MTSLHKALVATAVLLAPLGVSAQGLIFLGSVDTTGTGFGNVNTVLTLQSPANSTTEMGCIGPTGVSTCLPGDLVSGTAHSNLYTIGSFPGISGSNLRLFLNFAEPGGAANGATLDSARLTLYNGTTSLFNSTTGQVDFASTAPGIGNSAWLFGLSPSDAALFDSFLANTGSANYTLGLSASFSNVTGGPETFFFGVTGAPSVIPEPNSLALLGTGLIGFIPIVRRKRRG